MNKNCDLPSVGGVFWFRFWFLCDFNTFSFGKSCCTMLLLHCTAGALELCGDEKVFRSRAQTFYLHSESFNQSEQSYAISARFSHFQSIPLIFVSWHVNCVCVCMDAISLHIRTYFTIIRYAIACKNGRQTIRMGCHQMRKCETKIVETIILFVFWVCIL